MDTVRFIDVERIMALIWYLDMRLRLLNRLVLAADCRRGFLRGRTKAYGFPLLKGNEQWQSLQHRMTAIV
jgi:hypothetical protein